ncbi:TetR/AcrR family transcriptional regulator [Aeromicrobium sp. CTD01-1L150]|uniref:TetR/AcrR family transcriptional regulator n=1 Tax=Aeromicrobium sp. CTD01-1L150 TaxID=3341830 RepID=UPI0035BFA389
MTNQENPLTSDSPEGLEARNPPAPTVTVTTKQARSALSTRRLLDAAAELIAEVGLNNTTLAMIGERAGYSHGLVTRRFGSKEGLLMALVDRMSIGWFETYVSPEIDKATGIEALRIRISAIRRGWEISPRRMRALYALMFEGAVQPIPALREQMRHLHAVALGSTADAVRRGIEDGTILPKADPDATARFITSALRGVGYQALLVPDQVDVFDAMDDIVAYIETLAAD